MSATDPSPVSNGRWPSVGLLRRGNSSLRPFFEPRSIAVIGATERPGSVGRALMTNLVGTGGGPRVFPINPKRDFVLGLPALASIAAAPEPVDLAIVATPAATVPKLIRQCRDADVAAAIVMSAGFRESGSEGVQLEAELAESIRDSSLRVIGPNCVGLMCPRTGLNATFATNMVRPGRVALISQSGALLTAIIGWSLKEDVGFSAVVSVGSMVDVDWAALLDYFIEDPFTDTILLYMESVGDARAFLSAAREASLHKSVIAIKAGCSAAAAKAAASHTGAITGADDVLEAAFRRSGVLRVQSLSELFDMAEVLGKQPRPAGPRLAIVTNAGGPGVLATDALVRGGGELSRLADATLAELDRLLPPHWSHANPVDVLGDASPERFVAAAQVVAEDPNCDGILAIITPQAMTDPTRTAEGLGKLNTAHRTLLASVMGGDDVAGAIRSLQDFGVPVFDFPDAAANAFCHLWRNRLNIAAMFETPLPVHEPSDRKQIATKVDELIATVRRQGNCLLDEAQSKQLLALYGLPVVETVVAQTARDAIGLADKLGYPVALKLRSSTITHKSDVGGVRLNLMNSAEVGAAFDEICAAVAAIADASAFAGVTVQPMIATRDGYELFLGCSTDPQFGPVIACGLGGVLIEVLRDRAIGLPPLNTTLARRMLEQTRIYAALQGVRGRPAVDLAALEELIVKFSWLVAERREIREVDINPLFVSADGVTALDARIVLHPADTTPDSIPNLAIRPYPSEYLADVVLASGEKVTMRPIRPEDESKLREFHAGLSEGAVYQRYLHVFSLSERTAHDRLSRLCFCDYDREIALVAEKAGSDGSIVVGIVRLIKDHFDATAEMSIVVRDAFQGRGVGKALVRQILDVACREGVRGVRAFILPTNTAMQRLCRSCGAELQLVPALEMFRADFAIEATPRP